MDVETIHLEFTNFHRQMIQHMDSLYAYCETLKQPLLIYTGLNTTLKRLFETN